MDESSNFLETVCHRVISGDPPYYPQAIFSGQTIYFCTEACLHSFLEEPEKFLAIHSRRRES
jgi:YHS domain-containing protein